MIRKAFLGSFANYQHSMLSKSRSLSEFGKGGC
jgi:hypothetical protein